MAEAAAKIPTDAHNQVPMTYLAQKYNVTENGIFYVDLYPIQNDALLVICKPEVATQVSHSPSTYFRKHPVLKRDFGQALGMRGLVGLEGDEWREVRTMFNPGFSLVNLFSMVPMIVAKCEKFTERLTRCAEADGFVRSMESLAAGVTIDVIGHALLGVDFKAQTDSPDPIVVNVVNGAKQCGTVSDLSPQRLDLWRIGKKYYYDWASNSGIARLLTVRWKELKENPAIASESNAIFDIAMAKHMKRGGKLGDESTKDFMELIRDK